MTISLWVLFAAIVAYLGVLFLVASWADSGRLSQRWLTHPLTYTLSLGVYATSWTYYGSVGLAHSSGYLFLTIYLGVTLAFALTPVLLRPLLNLTREYQLSSVADLLSFRYGSGGLVVTIFLLIGVLPYLSLQIRAITESAQILTQQTTPSVMGFVFCIILAVFSVLFGARHYTVRDKHYGLVAAIAFESLVKLLALLCAGAVAIWGVFGGIDAIVLWSAEHPEAMNQLPLREQAPWGSFLLLSFCAAFLLPRQFHMMFHENLNPRALEQAAWMFPLFLLLLNVPIVPILWAGQAATPWLSPDFYVLGVAQASASPWLTLLIFLGGVSAASAMMIVTALALASMVLNHLVLPYRVQRGTAKRDLYRFLLWAKRLVIVGIIAAAYGFSVVIEHNSGLAQLGLVSFVAVAQLLPGVVGVLYWPRATRLGFLLGLSGGALVWFGLLILPLFSHSQLLNSPIALEAVFGDYGTNIWSVATFWTLSVNAVLFVLGSLLTRPTLEEIEAAERCHVQSHLAPLTGQVTAASIAQFRLLLTDVLGQRVADTEVGRAVAELELSDDEARPAELRLLRERIERNLSGLIGPALARLIVDDRLRLQRKTQVAFSDSIRFLETRLERSRSELRGVTHELDLLRRYHRDILQALPIGVVVVDPNQRVTVWNHAMTELSGISARSVHGVALTQLVAPWAQTLCEALASPPRQVLRRSVVWNKGELSLNLNRAVLEGESSATDTQQTGVALLVEDRSAIDHLEQELMQGQRLASIGQLAAGVAHEIGNPLTGIACVAQNLRDEDELGEIRSGVQDILTQTQRIDAIVRALLAMSHREGAETPVEQPIRPIIDDALHWIQLAEPELKIRFDVDAETDLCIRVDRHRIAQVLVNLLQNAIDASRAAAGDVILIRARLIQGVGLIDVQDRGIGIDTEQRAHIFDPFFTTKRVGEGTGLGLSLVHRIVHDHGGRIRAMANHFGGTTMRITLPPQDPV